MGSWAYVQYSYHLDGQEKNVWTANCGNRKKNGRHEKCENKVGELENGYNMNWLWIRWISERKEEHRKTKK